MVRHSGCSAGPVRHTEHDDDCCLARVARARMHPVARLAFPRSWILRPCDVEAATSPRVDDQLRRDGLKFPFQAGFATFDVPARRHFNIANP
jgi:hypothetical protein